MNSMDEAASQLEWAHVHSVYERIAPFFNDSRYKAWPRVKQFLLDQEPGSIVADVGCGNGKYLHINDGIFKLGCDLCRPLVDSAWSRGHEVQLCDGLRLPYRDCCFDAVLSIAVLHHMSTKARRIRALKEMARTLRPGGRVMIYVWAMEQKHRKFEKQDVFVPWNPHPPSHLIPRGRGRAPWRGDGPQRVGDAADAQNKHRNARSTSSAADENKAASARHQRRRGLWFFSRSLDSVLDFGSPTASRSSSRELVDGETSEIVSCGARSLMSQFSSFFSTPSARSSLDEDVFSAEPRLQAHAADERNSGDGGGGVAIVQDCSAVALPDLVPCRKGRSHGGDAGRDTAGRRSSLASLQHGQQWDGEKLDESCLRYYHVFREGELAQLIEEHVEELHVLHACLDHTNWCVVAEKV
ncbi:putative tRNA methyltransferase 9B [Brachyhypopomus gauderio]|uniref:putative tRNA methyltransferase 9B n=1 Tax=Brachyhypopomus gauderio TaxID=698409 RepID=UPI004042D865